MNITVPTNLWDEDTDAVITSWLVSDGAQVNEGDLIAEIMVEKIQHEIRSPSSGSIKISQPAEAVVSKGSVIGEIS